jgi:uncharacterized protein involved in outer membrane biogenesis
VKPVGRGMKILLGAVVALVLIALIAPYFLNADRYRPWIATQIEQATGRKVTLGKIHARLLPRPAFVLDSFSLGNPPGFPEGAVFSAETIRGNLAWGPLLHGAVELSSVALVHPKILLLEDDRGRTNYDFAARGAAGAGAAGAGGSSGPANVEQVELEDAELSLARVTAGARAPVPEAKVTKLSASLRRAAPSAAGLAQWDVDADLAGVQMEIAGLGVPIHLRSGNLQLRHGTAQGNFDADLGRAGQVKGQLQAADLNEGPINFQLSSPLLNLDQLFGSSSSASGPAAPVAKQIKHELLAQGRISAERVRWAPYEASQATAEMRIFTDRLELWPMTMAFGGGSLGASIWLDERARPERFSANVVAKGVDMARVMATSPSAKGSIEGRGDLTAQLYGTPGPDLMQSVTGNGQFALRDGRFPSFNLGGTLKSLSKVQQVFSLGTSSGGFSGETRFSLISGDMAVARGRVSSQRIHMDSNEGTVDMRGSFGLDGSLDYRGQAVLTPSSSGNLANPVDLLGRALGGVMKQSVGRISVPFSLRGTVDHLRIEPGAGMPSFDTGAPSPSNSAAPKAQSIIDLFRKPKP